MHLLNAAAAMAAAVASSALHSPTFFLSFAALAVLAVAYFLSRPRPVYLVDFAAHKPDPSHNLTRAETMRRFVTAGVFSGESIAFQRRVLERSGLGEATSFPASITSLPRDMCLRTARAEAEEVVGGAVGELLWKTGAAPEEIGVVIVNCSVFNPSPSLAAMVVRKFGLPEGVRTYNLAGMGCSAGVIAVDLAKRLLQVHRDTYALVISVECMTLNAYLGNHRPMLVGNALFRMGGAALLLSNRRSDAARAKYRLVHTVRTHRGAHEASYTCVSQEDDEEGIIGISLSKDLMAVAGEALKTNITTIGPLVLPAAEQFKFLVSVVLRKALRVRAVKPYLPDFKKAFDHFCIHSGGRGVLDELERSLALGAREMEPSRMTLHRFGNTSSSSLWYELAYCEAKQRIKKSDRVWQIAFGSGFKCNSAVWVALRAVDAVAADNPWLGELHKFPVDVPKVVPIEL